MMLGLSLSLVQPRGGGGGSASVLRTYPVSATEAFLIAPHATLGAVALHLTKGNGGVTTTPGDSVGAVFGDWRIQGLRILPSVASNPVTQATEIIYQGTGSQQIAVNFSNVWAGHWHGFGTGAAYAQTAPDMTIDQMVAVALISSSGDMIWTGASATWSDSFAINGDGSITTSATVNMAADALTAYLDMTIVNTGFTRASLDGGVTWIDLTTLTIYPAVGSTQTANVDTIIMRNPTTGTTVTVTDNSRSLPGFAVKEIARRSSDYKIYPNINPLPAGTNLGNVTVTRTITLGKTAPDPTPTYVWDGAIDGNSGFNRAFGPNDNITWDATSKQIVFTRGANASFNSRVVFGPIMPPVNGVAYTIGAILVITGSSPSAGTQISYSVNSNGSSGVSLPNAANGLQSYTIPSGAATGPIYLVFHQPGLAASDNVLRISRVGPVA